MVFYFLLINLSIFKLEIIAASIHSVCKLKKQPLLVSSFISSLLVIAKEFITSHEQLSSSSDAQAYAEIASCLIKNQIFSSKVIGMFFSSLVEVLFGKQNGNSTNEGLDTNKELFFDVIGRVQQSLSDASFSILCENSLESCLIEIEAEQKSRQVLVLQFIVLFLAKKDEFTEKSLSRKLFLSMKGNGLHISPELWSLAVSFILPQANEEASKQSQVGDTTQGIQNSHEIISTNASLSCRLVIEMRSAGVKVSAEQINDALRIAIQFELTGEISELFHALIEDKLSIDGRNVSDLSSILCKYFYIIHDISLTPFSTALRWWNSLSIALPTKKSFRCLEKIMKNQSFRT